MDDVFTFKKNFDDNKVVPEIIGRINLPSGNVIRVIFTPNGLKLIIPQESKDNGDIFWLDQNIINVSDLKL